MNPLRANEPAFPCLPVSTGLTVRQHFASLAMQGIISSELAAKNCKTYADSRGILMVDAIARLAVAHADALIAALEEKK